MSDANTGRKGLELEETLKEYFWQAGYFAVRGVPYRLDDEDVTDVDVWLYERPAALTRRRLIVDAKNKTKPKAAERLIWARGLQSALKVDGAIVASTDKRPSSRRLAKSVSVTLLDGDALNKLASTPKLRLGDQHSSEEYDGLFKTVDTARRSADWRSALLAARSSLLTSFGIHSANMTLRVAGFFGEQAVLAAPKSDQAQVALRGFYSACAYAAIGLDFVLADLAFQSHDERRAALVSGVRYGQTNLLEALTPVRTAIGLVRQHVSNGGSIAAQVERGFDQQAAKVPAEIIADYVARLNATDALYTVARELERNAFKIDILHYDALTVEARSLLGVFLDFHGISREKIANAARGTVAQQAHATQQNGNLFSDDTLKSTKPEEHPVTEQKH
ncbi:restriction endonuclease [Bradyrhizobium sp. dw_411]|uniref:restriction endonuclease n=1 Tax=Bradyrhizobium sp. dw_411 TaxID=2720082 RepID=UPI001BD08868|nr:restriction endonuclease [Bradyrhizobium sp. dw_411]